MPQERDQNEQSVVDRLLTDILQEPNIQDSLAGDFSNSSTADTADGAFQQLAAQIISNSILSILSDVQD